MLFDSHAHLHFSQFDGDREEIIKKLRDSGIKVVNVGVNLEDSEKAVNLAKKHPNQIWASVGIHPVREKSPQATEVAPIGAAFSNGIHPDEAEEDLNWEELKKLTDDKNVVAIGECGLDYYRNLGNQKSKIKNQNLQKEIFIKQIELAKELNKPLILHCRPSKDSQDAYEDALDILAAHHMSYGTAHFFSGSKETAKKFLDAGFCISFAGPITFAEEYRELVEYIPIDKILAETDAPFATPVPFRGKRNEPAFVEFTVRKIAQWKNLSFDKVAAQTHNNAKLLFKIC